MLLNKKYKKLLPTKKYIIDELVLVSAWKKAQQHIRSVNWYVDYLDLDKSAVELESRIHSLSSAISLKTLQLSPLQLIPAPKSYPWEFVRTELKDGFGVSEDLLLWCPKEKKEDSSKKVSIPLRPLAHVTIDDQTVFTAIMMLLADQVETEQGDPLTNFEDVHNKKVINYGNRLHCKYDDDLASYSWGNSKTYSQFFRDYQRFLTRPIYFGRKANSTKTNCERIYEVHLDFAKFYDCIDRKILIDKITALVKTSTGKIPGNCIQGVLNKFLNWEWTEESKQLYTDVCRNDSISELEHRKGIPQGLVAGGFFANIFMLEFDREVGNLIGKILPGSNVTLIDACRYVDDFRLIIKVQKSDNDIESLKKIIAKTFEPFTDKYGLNLQPTKTKVKPFSAKEGAISSKVADIQSKVSGPMPLHELDEQLGHLEGLIELSDNLKSEDDDNSILGSKRLNDLAYIDNYSNDVRKDTLLRFSANKIHKLLREKRNMISQDVNSEGKPISGNWDYLQERMARKFISKWTKDPSLTVLLKKGLELFPHVDLLIPILDNLDDIRTRDTKPEQVLFADYCLSEILRHSATAINTKDKWAFPAHSDCIGYFEYLENYSSMLLLKLDELSMTLREQVLFFCLVRNDSALDKEVGDKTFIVITKLLSGFRHIDMEISNSEFSTSILLAHQISIDKTKVIRSVVSCLDHAYKIRSPNTKKINYHDIFPICETIMLGDAALFKSIYLSAKKLRLGWPKIITTLADYLGMDDYSKIKGNLSDQNSNYVSLLSVLRMDNSPFKHENGILKLLQAAMKNIDPFTFSMPIDITNCKVKCSDWSGLLRLHSSCELSLELAFYEEGKQYHKAPAWLTKEHAPLYYLGMFIRSSLLGSIDWSGSTFESKDCPAYRGIKSNMLKRQIGMMHSPEAFGDSKSPMSNWLSTLLFKLLQWPGVESSSNGYSWPNVWNIRELQKLIDEQIRYQSEGFCHLSNMPTYVEKVSLDWPLGKKHLNVVMVQPLLPLVKHFEMHGLKLDSPKYRATHRRHTASVTELILHTIASVDSINEKPKIKGKVDLIVWPELSVSPDDIDILERLSDKTGAIIFAGIGFSHINNKQQLNNAAIWIIPNKKSSGRRFINRLQGKCNMTSGEVNCITPWRPYQLIVELIHPDFPTKEGFKLTGSICYDATDIKLSADLKDKSDAYIISAMNKDIATFDSMVDALFYHMYQHVILVNSGEFGGSVAKAPYKERFHKLITHVHGSNQVSISSFEMNMFDFRNHGDSLKSNKELKTPPAGS